MEGLRTLLRASPGAGETPVTAAIRRFSQKCLWDQLTIALFAVALLLVVLTFRSYGVTWDEDCQNWYGNLVLTYYLWLVGAAPAPHWELLYRYADLYNYGAVFDLSAAILNRFSPFGIFETRHLLNGVVGVVGLVGCWKLGRRLGGPRAGFAAALLLLLIPNYYGQMFNNPKDIPFAAGCIWATYYLVRIVPFLPRPPVRLIVKLGVAIGLAMAVRVGGLMLLCYLGLLLCLFGVWQAIATRRLSLLVGIGWTSLWRVFVPVSCIAYTECWCSGHGPKAIRSTIRYKRSPFSRRRFSGRKSCSTASSSPPTTCRGITCRFSSHWPCPNWCLRCFWRHPSSRGSR
jgi:hypothetical protein